MAYANPQAERALECSVVALFCLTALLAFTASHGVSRADLGFYKGGCTIHLKGAPKVDRRWRWGMGRALCPLRRKFSHFLCQNGELLCIPGDIY